MVVQICCTKSVDAGQSKNETGSTTNGRIVKRETVHKAEEEL